MTDTAELIAALGLRIKPLEWEKRSENGQEWIEAYTLDGRRITLDCDNLERRERIEAAHVATIASMIERIEK